MRNLSIILLGAMLLTIFTGCGKKQKVDVRLNKVSDIDSAFNIVVENPTNVNVFRYNGILRNYLQSHTDTQYTKIVLNKLLDYGIKQSNAVVVNIAYQNKAFEQLVSGNVVNAQYWARKSLETCNDDAEIDKLDIYQLMGVSYYYPPMNQDSVMKYWKLGFQMAIQNNDDYRIYFFANNLGTFFFDMHMYSIARQFFVRALNQSKLSESVPPMLINNILSTLLIEGKNDAAMDFYKENKQIFNVLPTGYENQVILLNKIHLFQIFDEKETVDSLFQTIQNESIHMSLMPKYTSTRIEQYLRTSQVSYLDSTTIKNAFTYGLDILDNISTKYINFDDSNLDFLWKVLIQSIEPEIKKIYAEGENPQANFAPGLVILIDYYHRFNTKLEGRYKLLLADYNIEKAKEPFEFQNYLSEVKDVDAMFKEILNRGQKIEFQTKRNQLLYVITIFILLLLLITSLYYRTRLELKNQSEKTLQMENDLNHRMIEFSKHLLSFNKKVQKDLDKLNFSVENADFLKKFKSDLLGFINVKTDFNPKLIDVEIENHESKTEEGLANSKLNKTEKRVYVLLQEGFKSNEIANMLGIATQYVYNVKAKLKKLGLELK